MAPELVVAIVSDNVAAAGWDVEHHRRNAEDTVERWAAGRTVRSDLPARVVAVLEPLLAPAVPLAPTKEEAQAMTFGAIHHPPLGLSTLATPCGLGKTSAARESARLRADDGKKVAISVPTTELARQVTRDLRAAGVDVVRIHGPANEKDPSTGEYVCTYRKNALPIAKAGHSVQRMLCEPCPKASTCPARKGHDGNLKAKVVVGPHALVGELSRMAGVGGRLIVDEPGNLLEEVTITAEHLRAVRHEIESGTFAPQVAERLGPGIAAFLDLLETAEIDTTLDLPELEAHQEALAAAEEIAWRGAPPLSLTGGALSRTVVAFAERMARACTTLRAIQRAYTSQGVTVTVYLRHPDAERVIAVGGVDARLEQAINRDGVCVAMGADVALYREAYTRAVGYSPAHTDVAVRDGCAVRRVHIQQRSATRSNILGIGRPPRRPLGALRQALELVGPGKRLGIVSYKNDDLREWVLEHAPEGTEYRHYGGLRGLDHWKDLDALVTLGDPRPSLGAVARMGLDADDLARAELEQAHGRLRVVHRERPATMIHVGGLRPAGWREPVEVHDAIKGRPARQAVDLEELGVLIAKVGGTSAAASACSVSRMTINRWKRGENAPSDEAVRLLREAAGVTVSAVSISTAITVTPDQAGTTGAPTALTVTPGARRPVRTLSGASPTALTAPPQPTNVVQLFPDAAS